MYIQLVEPGKAGEIWKSPILEIHNDHGEFMDVINKWKDDLIAWAKDLKWGGFPLGRLDVNTAMVDLMRELTNYYVNTTLNCDGRITHTLRLYSEEFVHKHIGGEIIHKIVLEK